MSTVCQKDLCCGCMACIDICPVHAISMDKGIRAYNANIDETVCIKCNKCHKTCQNNKDIYVSAPISWHEAWVSNDTIRKASSSGGVGAQLIRTFIKSYGEVYACQFADGEFKYARVDSAEQLDTFIGSKYIKSDPIGVYKEIISVLKNKKKVLFIGLPCQVAALKSMCGSDYSNQLYTVDLICHGSPSPALLKKYLSEHHINIYKISNIQFRNKQSFSLSISDNKIGPHYCTDAYTYAFLNGLDYTENCYSCKYARLERVADITIGDSWGSDKPESEQKKGISLVLCQSEKGQDLLAHSELHFENVSLEKAVNANHQLHAPSKKPQQRELFITRVSKHNSFTWTVIRIYYLYYIKQWVKEILRKLHIRNK